MAELSFQELNFQIDGMHCDACVRRVRKALEAVPGTTVEEVRIGAARVHAPDETAGTERYLAAIRKAGFEAYLAQ